VFKIGLLHSTAEKCSAGTTETHSIGANEKANWTAPLVPLKKLYCFTCATEKCSAGASETAVLALLKKKIKLVKKSAGATEIIGLL